MLCLERRKLPQSLTLRIITAFCIFALSGLLQADECDEVFDDRFEVGNAKVRIVHVSPDSPGLDVYLTDVCNPLVTDISYGEASSYVSVPPGTYALEVRATGAASDSTPAHASDPFQLVEATRTTALAAGLLFSENEDKEFRILPLEEGFGSPESDKAMVRLVHAGVDAPTVSVEVENGDALDIGELERFSDTGATGTELPANIELHLGAFVPSSGPLAAFAIPGLAAGSEIFLIATGEFSRHSSDERGFSLLSVDAGGAVEFVRQYPMIYGFNVVPDASSIDLYIEGSLFFGNLTFGEVSMPTIVPPGAYDYQVHAEGASEPHATAATPELEAGKRYLLTATGYLEPGIGGEPIQLTTIVDDLELDVHHNAVVRVLHQSPDTPALDVGTVDGSGDLDEILVTDLSFSESSDSLEFPPGSTEIGTAAHGSLSPVATFDVNPDAGDRGLLFIGGALTPDLGEEGFRLFLVLTSKSPWEVIEILPLN